MTMQRGRLFAGATALVLASAVGVVIVTKPDGSTSPG
ncbi:MAG: hypothetical protein QOH03_4816, partial [Kribbellaceae bacterium]|nr:hypothetical protein [Kribbellaceae bacterium]